MRSRIACSVGRLSAVAAIFVLAHAVIAAPPQYTVRNIGDPLNGEYFMRFMNNHCQVVGIGSVDWECRMWDNGTVRNLGSLMEPRGLTDSGVVLGTQFIAPPIFGSGQAVIWQNGQLTHLGMADASGMNAAGQIVGDGYSADNKMHVFLLDGNTLTDLAGTTGNVGTFARINDSGQIAATIANNVQIWKDGFWTSLQGLAGITGSTEYAMNNRGQVAGQANNQAFIYQDGAVTFLPMMAGETMGVAYDINEVGQVVGVVDTNSGGPYPALWENGAVYNLNNLVPTGSSHMAWAWAVNDYGQVLAESFNGTLFILTPVPEPATLGLLALGALGAIARRRM